MPGFMAPSYDLELLQNSILTTLTFVFNKSYEISPFSSCGKMDWNKISSISLSERKKSYLCAYICCITPADNVTIRAGYWCLLRSSHCTECFGHSEWFINLFVKKNAQIIWHSTFSKQCRIINRIVWFTREIRRRRMKGFLFKERRKHMSTGNYNFPSKWLNFQFDIAIKIRKLGFGVENWKWFFSGLLYSFSIFFLDRI